MHTARLVFDFLLLALALYTGVTFYLSYRKEAGTVSQRLLLAAKDSATILWQKFVIGVTALAGGAASLATDLGADPSVTSAIQTVLQPQYVAGFAIVVALVTIWARKRTLDT